MAIFSVTFPLLCLFGAAQSDTQPQPRLDPLPYTRLSEVTRSDRGTRATLFDQLNNRSIILRNTGDARDFQIRYLDGTPRLDGTVTHIGGRDMVFRAGEKEFAVHLGQSIGQAMDEPAAPAQIDALKKEASPAVAEKTFAFEMRDKPWGSVLEWLTDQTGLRNQSGYSPRRSFTFISPPNKTYTVGEILDILNEDLAQQGYLLIRRDDSFTIVPANEPVDPSILPRVKPDDLAKRGRYELVATTVPLGTLDAGDVIADIRRFFSRFGNVTYLSRSNQLLMQDTAGNLRTAIDAIKEMEAHQPAKADAKTVSIDFRDAPWVDVFAWLGEQTGLPVVSQMKPTGTLSFTGPPNKTYTIPEAVDIVNEALMVRDLMLIRRGHSFALVASDEPVDSSIVPRIKISDLPARGNTELVSLVMSLTNLSPDDAAIEVERVLGPLGRATPLAKSNQLVLQDTAGNLKRAIETVRAMEENAPQRPRQ
jgi:hypothetical protein